MSFGFSGNNNTNTSSFGGFGSSNTGGFGANTNTTTTGSLFGGGTATSGGFSGFGANNANSSPFGGNKSTFGAPAATTSGGSLFGSNPSNTSTTGGFGGGFGNTANTGSGFGSSTGGGGLFGQNKPATGGFGSSNSSSSLFGGGNTGGAGGGFGTTSNTTGSIPFAGNTNTTNTGFGATTATGGFGGFGASSTATNNNNGTAAVPFQPFTEKEGTTNATSSYQSISFQDPYRNKSFEELRAEDYAQGRKYGNTNGQAGGFGTSTGFGGFGSTNASSGGSMFGSNNATSGGTGFGGFGNNSNTNASAGFGSNTGGSLFGQNKPAGGGLFGNAASTGTTTGGFGSTSGSGGGLFGNNPGGGFGAGANANANTSNTSGGLFGGSNNTQPQNNPFGASNTNAGGGLFGNQNKPAGGGLFGSTNTSNTGGGLFANNNQPQNSNPFGSSTGSTGGGLFGNANTNQNKPAFSGFGSSNTGSGFSSNTNTGGGLFGNTNNNNNNTGGGLFGNQNQNKPTSTGLFGSNTNTNTGGSLFGNNNNNQGGSNLFGNSTNTGGSLFGNQNKPAGGGLFGNTNTSNQGAGASLFGANQNQHQNPGLFGNTNNQGGSSLFGNNANNGASLWGAGQQPPPQQQQNQLHASITGSPYGNDQLFSSLAAPSPPVGPLATPLSNARPAPRKTPSLLGSMRLNTPVYSPRGSSLGRNAGYGFSYSTYGTPGSAYSGSLTPGASSLLRPTGSLSSGLTSRLNKSVSMSNLRGDSTPNQGSLLRPDALSPPGSGAFSNGSVRKLKIDRSLRTDLFGPSREAELDGPASTKRVSFQDFNAGEVSKENDRPEPNNGNALVRTETDDQDESSGLLRSGPQTTESKVPEMTQIRSNAGLSSVPEDEVPPRPSSAPSTKKPAEKASRRTEIGDYWTDPPIKTLEKMSRQQLQKLGKFTVGRGGVGRIEFGPCDLTSVPLEDICGDIVRLNPRSATVYQDDANKPEQGKALNVPSVIHLENSWPRSHGGKKVVNEKSGKDYDKHIARLKRVAGTQFVKYEPDSGVWTFKVEHFTTYGLDDEDEDDEDYTEQHESSRLSEPPATPGPHEEETMQSIETATGEMEDTFQFKFDKPSQLSVPGGFGSTSISYDYDGPTADEVMDEDQDEHMTSGGLGEQEMEDPFTSGGPVKAPSPGTVERYQSSLVDDQDGDAETAEITEPEPEMPGSFIEEPKVLRSILKPSVGISLFTSPEKLASQTWEEQLQCTISPRKRDRQALKDMQQSLMQGLERENAMDSPFKQSFLARSNLDQSYLAKKSGKKDRLSGSTLAVTDPNLGKSQAFHSAMDVMKSLWQDDKKSTKMNVGTKGFEYPYPKKPRLSDEDMTEQDVAFHDSLKPSFTTSGTLVYASSASTQVSGEMMSAMPPMVDEHKDICFANFVAAQDIGSLALEAQKQNTKIESEDDGVPFARTPDSSLAGLSNMLKRAGKTATVLQRQELAVWRLSSILFDPLTESSQELLHGVPDNQLEPLEPRIKLDAFTGLWAELVAPSVQTQLKQAKNSEEKALLYLTVNDVSAACDVLAAAKDFRLAALIAQLPASKTSRAMMKQQIHAWQTRKDWSEMSDATRALYSILGGEVCVVPGQAGAAEDRAADFSIAETFDLSWQQSLALRSLFAGHSTLAEAVTAYCEDLESSREVMYPTTMWDSEADGDRFADKQDTLMSLLRLFAGKADVAQLFDPLTVSGRVTNSRLAWQMASILSAKHTVELPDTLMDQLSVDFAFELESAGNFATAAWLLLHVRNNEVRFRAVVALLDRNASVLSSSSPSYEHGIFEVLTHDLRIPAPLVWAAKALYAKSENRFYEQIECLLKAGHEDEAHEVLCTTVGPQAVIEQDQAELWRVLRLFPKRASDEWQTGWQVYHDYLHLLRMQPTTRDRKEGKTALQSFRGGLAGMVEVSGKTLEQRVAVLEMKKFADEVAREQSGAGEEHYVDVPMAGATRREAGLGMGMLEDYHRALGQVA